jgi:hypothetical protein
MYTPTVNIIMLTAEYILLTSSAVVSFRITKGLLEKAKKYKINIPDMARDKVVEEISRIEREEQDKVLRGAAAVLSNVTRADIVKAVRDTRES